LIEAGASGHADPLHAAKVTVLSALRAALADGHNIDDAVRSIMQFDDEALGRGTSLITPVQGRNLSIDRDGDLPLHCCDP
jgi:hypothetical protein